MKDGNKLRHKYKIYAFLTAVLFLGTEQFLQIIDRPLAPRSTSLYHDFHMRDNISFHFIYHHLRRPMSWVFKGLRIGGLLPGRGGYRNEFQVGALFFFIKRRALKMVLKLQISYKNLQKNRGDGAPLEHPYIRPCVFYIILLSLQMQMQMLDGHAQTHTQNQTHETHTLKKAK